MSTEYSRHFIKKYFPFLFIVIPAIFLFNAELCLSQTRAEGITPKMTEPGSPAGSYSLSGFESINLFNGNLNFSLPLASIGGRGKAKSRMSLTIDSARWNVEKDGLTFGDPATMTDWALRTIARVHGNSYSYFDTISNNEYCLTSNSGECPPGSPMCHDTLVTTCEQSSLNDAPTSADIIEHYAPAEAGLMVPNGFFYQYYTVRENLQDAIVGYGPGMLVARGGKIEPLLSRQPSGYKIRSLTRLFFLSPDGTEYELRDVLTGGKDKFHWGHDPFNRQTVFEASDGSGLRFVSNEPIIDFWVSDNENLPPTSFPSGVLYFPDGTKYGVTNGNVIWIKDVDGNKVTFTYNAQKQVTGVTDSLGRQIVVNYAQSTNDPEVKFDEIKTQISASDWQTIKVYRTKLENVLRNGYQLMTETQMFPALQYAPVENLPPYNPDNVVQKVELPDGRGYNLYYTPYKEIARVELPTGAAIEYDFPIPAESSPAETVFRPVKERRVYKNGGSITFGDLYDSRQVYLRENFVSNFSSFSGKIGVQECAGKTNAQQCDVNTRTDHYFYGAANTLNHSFYPKWNDGKEHKTELFSVNGTTDTLKSRTETEWEYPAVNPAGTAPKKVRVKSVTSTIFEGSQSLTSKTVYGYDNDSVTNNKTDEWIYDYGITVPGRLIKHSQTSYLEVNSVNNQDYTDPGIYLLGFPESTKLYDVSYTGAETLVAQTETKYDEMPQQGNLSQCGINLSLTGWQEPATAVRGNVTKVRKWNNANNSWIESKAEFDCFGNAIKAWDPLNNMSQVLFDPQYLYGFPTSAITPAPDATGIHGSNASFTALTEYDFYTGQIKKTTDINAQQTTTEYLDPLNRPTKVTAPNGQQTIFEYGDTVGNLFVKVKKQIDEINWDETTTFFDGLGRSIKKQAKDSQGDVFVDTVYDELGRIEQVSSPYRNGDDVYWTKSKYDALGRVVESFAPSTNPGSASRLSTTEYSLSTTPGFFGTVAVVADVNERKGRSINNIFGQLVRVDEPDSDGNLTPLPTSTPAPTPTPGSTPSPTPDPTPTPDPGCGGGEGQIPCVENGEEYAMNSTYYKYDPLGRMVEVTQGVQKRYFLYDSLGRLLRVKQPEQEINTSLNLSDPVTGNSGWSSGFVYDDLGRLLRSTDANGINIVTEYDVANRVLKRCYTNPNTQTTALSCGQISGNQVSETTPAVEYYYDGKGLVGMTPQFALGQTTKVTSAISTTEYLGFDNMGRLLSHRQSTDNQSFTTGYKYDLSGNMLEEIYPSGEVVRNFLRSDGNLSRVAVSGHTYASDPTYTAAGGVSSLKLGNGRWETTQFNQLHQVTRLALGTSANDTSLWRTDYEYGKLLSDETIDPSKNDGTITRQTLSIPGQNFVQTFKYDSLSRLVEAQEKTAGSQNWLQNLSYDRFGNRLTFEKQVGNLTETETPQVDQNTNRLVSGQNFEYDKNGNLIRQGSSAELRTFTFNGDNKQVEVKNNLGTPIGTYFYDAAGNRVKKVTITGETTIFVYDGLNRLVAEYSNQTAAEPAVTFTTTDNVGSPRVLTDKSGNVTSRRDFMPFGEELLAGTPNRSESAKYSAGGDSIRKKFTGFEKDPETGLDYAQARYYNNEYGRFTAVDPLLASGKAAAPQTFNRYTYVRNNPLIYVDTNGLDIHIAYQETDGRNLSIKITAIRDGDGKMIGRNITNGNGDPVDLGANGRAVMDSIGRLDNANFGSYINKIVNAGQHVFNMVPGSAPEQGPGDNGFTTGVKWNNKRDSATELEVSTESTVYFGGDGADTQFGTAIVNAGEYLNLEDYHTGEFYGNTAQRFGFNRGSESRESDQFSMTEFRFRQYAFNNAQIITAQLLGITVPVRLWVVLLPGQIADDVVPLPETIPDRGVGPCGKRECGPEEPDDGPPPPPPPGSGGRKPR